MKEFVNKLIGRLEELKTYYAEDFSQGYSCEVDCVEKYEVKKIVNELAEEYKGGWIACSDRLPEKNGYYLVTQKRYSISTHGLIRIETDYVRFEGGKWGRANYFEIIAWMPLPAPYKEGE